MAFYKKHIVIVGTARSGTSWLSEIIARQHRYRLLFEPEHESNTKKGRLICDQWITEKSTNTKINRYFKQIFTNTVDSDWIAQNSNRKFKRHLWPFIPKKYIIKFVRGNLFAHYINSKYQIPVIHIVRNPYDVIRSQRRSKFPWLTDLSIFAKQQDLVDLIQTSFNLDISDTSNFTEIEIQALRWCIENVIPLEVLEPHKNEAIIVKYEDITSNIDVFYKLCETLNIQPIESIEKDYRKPSSKTHPKSDLRNKANEQLTLSIEETQQITRILDLFKTNLYLRPID